MSYAIVKNTYKRHEYFDTIYAQLGGHLVDFRRSSRFLFIEDTIDLIFEEAKKYEHKRIGELLYGLGKCAKSFFSYEGKRTPRGIKVYFNSLRIHLRAARYEKINQKISHKDYSFFCKMTCFVEPPN